jgi:hypothetical protein
MLQNLSEIHSAKKLSEAVTRIREVDVSVGRIAQ